MEKEEYIEKYNRWNIKKQNIHFLQRLEEDELYFKEGDVWWCSIGLNVGNESFGKGKNFRRPVLVLKKLSADLCVALPLTSQIKIGTWFVNVTLNGEDRYVMMYQIRALNKKRFTVKIGEIDGADFKKVKEKLKTLLELF